MNFWPLLEHLYRLIITVAIFYKFINTPDESSRSGSFLSCGRENASGQESHDTETLGSREPLRSRSTTRIRLGLSGSSQTEAEHYGDDGLKQALFDSRFGFGAFRRSMCTRNAADPLALAHELLCLFSAEEDRSRDRRQHGRHPHRLD